MNAEYESVLKLCNQAQLEAMLKEVETRLGTAEEKCDDFERARAIAHQIDNHLLCLRLKEELEKSASVEGPRLMAFRLGPGLRAKGGPQKR